MPRAVVLVIDGLGARHLGPYGNTWIETPAANYLAAESLVFDRVAVPYADRWKSLEAVWRGRSALGGEVDALEDTDLLSWLRERDVTTHVMTDDPELLDQQLSGNFSVQSDMPIASGVKLTEMWDETHAAQFFAQAVNLVEGLDEDSLLWLHTKGLANPWDAPYEYRAQFADEEDPEPSGSAQVPNLSLDADYDPDTLHEIQCALAGQVVLLDQCLGVLLSVIQSAPKDTLFLLTAMRGFPLGEHLRVGFDQPALFQEFVHVPMFVRYPDGRNSMSRNGDLAEACDASRILVDWFSPETAAKSTRRYSLTKSGQETLLRTPCWHVRFPDPDSFDSEPTLFLKPDDQNEVNDVASRCREVAEAAREFVAQLGEGTTSMEIPAALLESVE